MSYVLPHSETIMAILPCYTETGDGAEIITNDGGRALVMTGVAAVIRRIARQNAIDLDALQCRMRQAFRRSHRCVIPLSPGLVLCKVKTRRPKVDGDTTFGYINVLAVKKVQTLHSSKGFTRIELAGGAVVTSLWSKRTVEEYIAMARLAAQLSAEPAADPQLTRLVAGLIQTLLRAANGSPLSG